MAGGGSREGVSPYAMRVAQSGVLITQGGDSEEKRGPQAFRGFIDPNQKKGALYKGQKNVLQEFKANVRNKRGEKHNRE